MKTVTGDKFDIQYLRDNFSYCPATGALTRNSSGHTYSTRETRGYVYFTYKGKAALAHRAIWAIVHGYEPTTEIDHINGCRSDNRISNLRSVTTQQNRQNSRISSRNKSGVKGVIWEKSRSRWRACVNVSGENYLARFRDIGAAKRWVEETRRNIHGDHANHG